MVPASPTGAGRHLCLAAELRAHCADFRPAGGKLPQGQLDGCFMVKLRAERLEKGRKLLLALKPTEWGHNGSSCLLWTPKLVAIDLARERSICHLSTGQPICMPLWARNKCVQIGLRAVGQRELSFH